MNNLINEQEIAKRAYDIWEKSGRPDGNKFSSVSSIYPIKVEQWFEARKQIAAEIKDIRNDFRTKVRNIKKQNRPVITKEMSRHMDCPFPPYDD